MDRTVLAGRCILVVEDEVLIALDIADSLRAAGASVVTARTVCDGLRLAEEPQLSAAVLDLALSDGSCAPLCDRLNQRRLPFVLYTGFDRDVHGVCHGGIRVAKPASPQALVDALADVLPDEPVSNR
jgi:DNA-binding response OmpR family regulator